MRQEEDVTSIAEPRLEEWTAPAAEPTVRAAAIDSAGDHPHDPIARWEWEGGAIAVEPIGEAHI